MEEIDLKKDTIIYKYAKKLLRLNTDGEVLKKVTEENNIFPKAIYSDFSMRNYLSEKPNLKKILSKKNINILVYSFDRLTRNNFELLEIQEQCKKNNITIYDRNGYELNKTLHLDIFSVYPTYIIKEMRKADFKRSKRNKEKKAIMEERAL